MAKDSKTNLYLFTQVAYNDKDKTVKITGTTGVAALYGLNDYLKYHCYCHISWEGSQLELPNPLPSATYKRQILDRHVEACYIDLFSLLLCIFKLQRTRCI